MEKAVKNMKTGKAVGVDELSVKSKQTNGNQVADKAV